MPKTYNDLLLDGRHILRHIGVEAAELESRELLAYAAGKDRQTLLRDLRLYVQWTCNAVWQASRWPISSASGPSMIWI